MISQVLADIGVISGRDMTLEAALTKLCVVLGYPDLSHDQRVEVSCSIILPILNIYISPFLAVEAKYARRTNSTWCYGQ